MSKFVPNGLGIMVFLPSKMVLLPLSPSSFFDDLLITFWSVRHYGHWSACMKGMGMHSYSS